MPVLNPCVASAASQGSSEYSDSDLDVSRRRSRRSHKAQVNYCETSESEGSQAGTNREETKLGRRLDTSESEGNTAVEMSTNLFTHTERTGDE